MTTEMLILAFVAVLVSGAILGVVAHAWASRQTSPTLTLDAIGAASALLAAAAKTAADDVTAATERQHAVAVALSHAAARLAAAPAAAPVAPPVA